MKTRIENSQRSVPRDRRLSSRTIRTFLEPDLVVTDLHMPGLDGAEVTRRLKQRLNAPIVFVVTSDDTPEARARCVAAGADAFLVKAGNVAPRLLSAIQEFFPDDCDWNGAEPQHHCESLTTVI